MNDGAACVATERDTPVVDGAAVVRRALSGGSVRVSYAGDSLLAAGSLTRYSVSLAADFALPAGARFALARRWPSDWGTPQWSRAEAENYVRVFSSAASRLRWWTVRLHAWHPFDHVMVVELLEPLAAGQTIGVSFGDDAGGSPGFGVQTFLEEASPLSVRLLGGRAADSSVHPSRFALSRQAGGSPPSDGRAADSWAELARFVVRITGTAARRLVVTVPGRAQSGRGFPVHLRVEDEWGNPAVIDAPVRLQSLSGPISISASGPIPVSMPIPIPAAGWCRIEASVAKPGIHRLEARVDGRADLSALSNPLEVVSGAFESLVCWGDLHAQSVIGCGARSIDDYFRHARDFAATDFGSHQANCFLVSNDEWQETQRSTRSMNDDGRFVTLLGVEWSAASRLGGDHNLYFPGDTATLRRCSHEFVADKSDVDCDLPHVDDLYAHYRETETLIAVHVGGRTADLQFHEPGLDRLLEVHSTHATSEWFLFDALRRGHRMGVVAGSDSVDGRPGASHPGRMGVRNVRGGLTAVEVTELTRPALWRALKARRCYATTGERILLSFSAGDWRMGDEASFRLGRDAALPDFEVRVTGTAPIEAIDFFRDDQLLASHDGLRQASGGSDRVRVAWRGASAPGNWQRARMQWDGVLRVEGARILDASPWAFDTPDEGLTEVTGERVAWRSVTAGDWDGVVLTLDRVQDALLTFCSTQLNLQCRLGDLDPAGWREEQESPWRCVEIRCLPAEDPPLQCQFAFQDPEPVAGPHAYWVRVRQTDGAYAWSTPIFLDLTVT